MPLKLRPKDIVYLKKGTVRQNWSIVTLYNLSRLSRQKTSNRTFFQQKYTAKQETRKYHGEHLTKRQWQNIFSRSLKSVVPMNTRELASSDGSEYGAGRGAGLDGSATKVQRPVPYMNQTFAPMERRLDMAVFRAMFASSALQARQFVIHGFVKVNGKKMQYPQYMLNPGDMFSVDLEKVLFATGAPKGLPRSQDPKYINRKKSGKDEREAPEAAEGDKTAKTEGGEASAPASSADVSKVKAEAAATQAEVEREQKSFNKSKEESSGINWWDDPNRDRSFDPLKPYRTPWRPRYFLSAFTFIPKYLEVNHNIGHAVYLRDPVAKPGQSEVPTPFHHETLQLAYSWFLRRR
ncbi:alpha-L RNA-binding motif-containing protein [Wilcoxina mikolae CBS 423.85]|nr:alpha-L RNA-binding motif-containing protein [Wilcoxina mikolae CBS 423.85]